MKIAAVYLGYTQEELDRQYNQASLVPDPSGYIEEWKQATDRAKLTLNCCENIAYGNHEDEQMDLYLPDKIIEKNRQYPLLVFCHGGAWRSLSKNESGYLAPIYGYHGIAVAVLNFSLTPDVDLGTIIAQVRRAILFIYENAERLSVDSSRIHILGHSSGAHLASNAAVTDWSKFGGPQDLIKGLIAVSGPYDLEPVRLSARNDYLKLSQGDARRFSPNFNLRLGIPPAIFAWGGGELEEFQRQSVDLADAWFAVGSAVDRIFVPEKNHFEMGSEIANSNSSLMKAVIGQFVGE